MREVVTERLDQIAARQQENKRNTEECLDYLKAIAMHLGIDKDSWEFQAVDDGR